MKPHLRACWCIPPPHSAEFVAAMEDVLDVYCRPYDAARPVVCMDETCKQLVAEVRPPIPAAPGQCERYDMEYERCGVAEVFLFTEPLGGWRRTAVTEHRARLDWARQIWQLLDVDYPHAEMVVLVMDNLNTHSIASLYEAFEPEVARRLAQRLEIHHTPKHGSWLNIAENELSSMTRQSIGDRRIGDLKSLREQIRAWSDDVNDTQRGVDWQMIIDDARCKLKSVYPKIKL